MSGLVTFDRTAQIASLLSPNKLGAVKFDWEGKLGAVIFDWADWLERGASEAKRKKRSSSRCSSYNTTEEMS